ncbi:MAG TPA: hypothetical protein VFT66_09310 [Roseiflexaceae bacterium]|jgi:hypothetical protein|nr:hypothetical protein [Roseiflexaceae bacterium]
MSNINLVFPERFQPLFSSDWRRLRIGSGELLLHHGGLRLLLPGAHHTRYSDAQIDDYGAHFPPTRFRWQPPLRMTVEARASGALVGTAGFGFWNNPLATAGGLPALPAAIWFFFAAPPSDMPLAMGVPGHGYKAACIDATRPSALAWAPVAPAVMLLNNLPAFKRRVWPRAQRALSISEAMITPATQRWRTYTLEWRHDGARFSVDGETVLETDRAPRGPLGFIAWIDNQWAVVTPQGRLGWGLSDARAQWLDLRRIDIEQW